MKENTTKPTKESSTDESEIEETPNNEDVEATELELDLLNTQLDQLNSVLDVLEQKNDDIQAQLKILLQSSRAARQQLQSTATEREQSNSN